MFTGIIEITGRVHDLRTEGSNLHLIIKSSLAGDLKIDQSVSHNGVCLTVVELQENMHTVTAVDETLRRSNLGLLETGDLVNLERCMLMNGRLDGHIVQGHVDQTAICQSVEDRNGSWIFRFNYDPRAAFFTVEKGSVCVNGVSLTVVESQANSFTVAIIPYTYEHTNFKQLLPGSTVNIEFDIIGKYVAGILSRQNTVL